MCPGDSHSESGQSATPKNDTANDLASLQRRTALLDHINSIPPFSGDTNSVNLVEFLDNFNNLSDLFNWDEKEKLFALNLKLSGTASRVFRTHKGKSFKDIVGKLKDRFCRIDPPEVALSKFLAFKQPHGMLVQDFYDRATDLATNALVIDGVAPDIVEKSRNAMLHSMLLNNLAPALRKGVIARDPKSPQEILQLAILEEKACLSVNPFYTANADFEPAQPSSSIPKVQVACAATPAVDLQAKKEISELKEQISLLTAKFDSLLTSQAQNKTQNENNQQQQQQRRPRYRNFRTVCFFCNEFDHIATICPYKYREEGNYENNQNYSPNNYRGRGGNSQRGQTSHFFQPRGGRFHSNRGGFANYRGRGGYQSHNNSFQHHDGAFQNSGGDLGGQNNAATASSNVNNNQNLNE